MNMCAAIMFVYRLHAMCVCLCLCPCVNQRGANHNRYTERLFRTPKISE